MKNSPMIAIWLTASTFMAVCADEPMRIWTDDSGKFRMEAQLTSLTPVDGKIKVRRADGHETAVPIQRLSTADRRYITRVRKRPARIKPTHPETKRRGTQHNQTEHHYGIDWHRTLATVIEAESTTRTGTEKPIMCLRVLGDLDGFM